MKFPTLDGLLDAEVGGDSNNEAEEEVPIGDGFVDEKVKVEGEEPGKERVERILHKVDFASDGDLILFC